MSFTLLYPDGRSNDLDIERAVTGNDAVLINPRKNRFDAIEPAEWEKCDGIVVRFVPIDANAVKHLKRARIVVRAEQP